LNMGAVKVVSVTVLVAIVINLHSTDGLACQLPQTFTTGAASTATSQYSTMSALNQNCASACFACGQVLGADTQPTSGSLTGTVMQTTLGPAICPSLTYAAPAANDGTTAGSITAAFLSSTYTLNTANTAISIGSRQQQVTTVTFVDPTVAQVDATAALLICPCLYATANTCPICGCDDLGLPTAAPTNSPTTAPTFATDSPTNSINISDDSLSSGDIAGIVIGAVAGSFLFLLIGVLVGGMVGGKSAAPAAPAGQL